MRYLFIVTTSTTTLNRNRFTLSSIKVTALFASKLAGRNFNAHEKSETLNFHAQPHWLGNQRDAKLVKDAIADGTR